MRFVPRVLADGRAVALGGYIHRIDDDVIRKNLDIPSAAADLGGAAELTQGPYAFEHGPNRRAVLTCKSSIAKTWQERDGLAEDGSDATHTVHTQSRIEGLAVDNRLFVDRANAYLKTVHRFGDKQPSIIPLEADIQGLTIDGVKFRVTLDRDPVTRCPTCDEFHQACEHDGHLNGTHGHRVLSLRHGNGPDRGSFVCSLVERIEWEGQLPEGAEVDHDSHVIVWPNFGKVILGEMLISDYTRRLTMLRFELGSPLRARFVAGDVESTSQGLP